MPIPDDRCQRCTAVLGEQVWRAERDRVCDHCARTARARDELVEPMPGPEPTS